MTLAVPLLLLSCIGRSLAMLMLSSSAIGNASRRNLFWPDVVSRPVCATPAINFVATPERDQREPETQ